MDCCITDTNFEFIMESLEKASMESIRHLPDGDLNA